ncbi:MAG: D-alanine--D-alanine ligase [Treponema sp.]|jgi:D-alanine-D-alanine ligase|nr:D-alanine--D-alanine ligase [Treponema sp.]
MSRQNIGILCGGRSAEHEVSLQSALNVFDAVDRSRFNPLLIGIDKAGSWWVSLSGDLVSNVNDPRRICLARPLTAAALLPNSKGMLAVKGQKPVKLDVIFPLLHGPFGEDGTVQGLLKLADVPFVGPGVLGSAAGMDKDVMKRLLRDAGIPIGKFFVLRAESPDGPPQKSFAYAGAELGAPFFVKPANMGSSVGVSKVNDETEYIAAVREAFKYDRKVIVEENISGREIECAVLGNEDPRASLPGEIRAAHDFYSYEAKYIDAGGAALIIPAELPPETVKRVQDMAVRTFRALECQGLSRVDFFVRENGEALVNEINTMPGFTRISMYPKLWAASGVPYTELINRLIDLAVERFGQDDNRGTGGVTALIE